jgi:hypothetical protein
LGVDEAVDYKQSDEDVVKEIVKKTDGKMYRIFDATSQYNQKSVEFFKPIEGKDKWFSSTNDW